MPSRGRRRLTKNGNSKTKFIRRPENESVAHRMGAAVDGTAAPVAPQAKCDFWLPKKRRACGMLTKAGSFQCGNHQLNGPKRLRCEFCKTNVPAAGLVKHLNKCPAKAHQTARQHVPYFVRDVNVGDLCAAAAAVAVASRPPRGDQLRALAKRVRDACALCGVVAFLPVPETKNNERCATATRALRDAQVLAAKRNGPTPSPFEPKHAAQHASIVAHMVDAGLVDGDGDGDDEKVDADTGTEKRKNDSKRKNKPSLKNPKPVYAELGAGRGYLSHFLVDAFGPIDLVLVERDPVRFKAERSLGEAADLRRQDSVKDKRRIARREKNTDEAKGIFELPEDENLEDEKQNDDYARLERDAESVRERRASSSCLRLRLDIKDLHFAGVTVTKKRNLVLIGKHLCGAATDLALRSCFPETETDNKKNETKPEPDTFIAKGVCVATCCHHRCEWGSYVNKYFIKSHGFSVEEFGWLTRMSSWGVLGAAGGHDIFDDVETSEIETLDASALGALEHVSKKRRKLLETIHLGGEKLGAGVAEGTPTEGTRTDSTRGGSLEGSVSCGVTQTFSVIPRDGEDMSPTEKHELGCMIKTFLDVGRLRWLEGKGLVGSIRRYCETNVSPENRLLLASAS